MNTLVDGFIETGHSIESAVLNSSSTTKPGLIARITNRKPAIAFTGARLLCRDANGLWNSSDLTGGEDDSLYAHWSAGSDFVLLMDFTVRTKRAASRLSRLKVSDLKGVPAEFDFEEVSTCGADNEVILEFSFHP
ncbi:hypothetical protein ACVLV4_000442 [Rathayibacter agropyri]